MDNTIDLKLTAEQKAFFEAADKAFVAMFDVDSADDDKATMEVGPLAALAVPAALQGARMLAPHLMRFAAKHLAKKGATQAARSVAPIYLGQGASQAAKAGLGSTIKQFGKGAANKALSVGREIGNTAVKAGKGVANAATKGAVVAGQAARHAAHYATAAGSKIAALGYKALAPSVKFMLSTKSIPIWVVYYLLQETNAIAPDDADSAEMLALAKESARQDGINPDNVSIEQMQAKANEYVARAETEQQTEDEDKAATLALL